MKRLFPQIVILLLALIGTVSAQSNPPITVTDGTNTKAQPSKLVFPSISVVGGIVTVNNTGESPLTFTSPLVRTVNNIACATCVTTADKDATGGYAGLTLFKIDFKNAANTFTSFFTNSNSAARTYTFQNRDGTIADDTDLAAKQNTVTFGTGVQTALGVNVGTAGSPVLNGGALGSPSSIGTLPAYTLGGTISGGGNAINNVVIGGVTPLAGSFTTVNASTSATIGAGSAITSSGPGGALTANAYSATTFAPLDNPTFTTNVATPAESIGFGATTPPSGPLLAVATTISTSPRGIASMQFSTDTSGARVGFFKARGSIASPSTLVTGDTLGRLMFRGYVGATNTYVESASIEAVSSGTVADTSTGRLPSSLVFSTSTDASPSVLTTRLTIDNTGASNFAGDVLPTSTQNLGSATLPWLTSTIGNTTQYETVSQSAGVITHAALGSASNIYFLLAPKGSPAFGLVVGGATTTDSQGVYARYLTLDNGVANPATAGAMRFSNNSGIQARNAGNSANVPILKLNASDQAETGAPFFINGGGLLFVDNTYDIGASGATRPRTGYFGTSVRAPRLDIGTVLTFSSTAPTIGAGFGTSPSVAGTAVAFTITVGTGGTDSTGTITLPTATTGWIVTVQDVTTPDSFVTAQTGGTTTTATVKNYSRTTGLGIAWTAGDVLRCTAVAY